VGRGVPTLFVFNWDIWGNRGLGFWFLGFGGGWVMGGVARPWAQELERRAGRQLLHSSELWFRHPILGQEMHFSAPPPTDMASIVSWARAGDEPDEAPGADEMAGDADIEDIPL
jgi:hypothetical protein